MFAALVIFAALQSIRAEHDSAEAGYAKAVQALPDTPDGEKQAARLWKAFDAGQGNRFLAALELAKADPTSETALDALEWVLSIPRSYYLAAGIPAMKLATEHHAANPRIGKLVAILGSFKPHYRLSEPEHAAAMELFRAVAMKNPSRTARGQASLPLARHAHVLFAVAEHKRSADVERLAAEAEKQLESVLKEYGKEPHLVRANKRTLGDVANEELFELRYLRIGKTAPDIEAEDLDGKRFKLSDSRGKVTVLVFWAGWCGPCMREVPHEKKLVQRLKNKPFALIGVNGDETQKKAREIVAKEGINWRSFWDGSENSISRSWNIPGWPSVYVLDEKGVIRFKHLRGEELDKALDELLEKK